MRMYIAVILLGIVSVTGLGCGVTQDREAAVRVAEGYFENIKQEALDSLEVFLGERLLAETPADEVARVLSVRLESSGGLESYTLVGWHVDKRVGVGGGSGTYVTLQYHTSYQNGAHTETLTLFSPGSADSLKIISHAFGLDEMSRK